jgi:arylsulfatase A-like enzyme
VAGAANTTAAAIAYWAANRPALMFLHLDNVDHDVGRLLDTVDALSARESTYILVTSDHGGTKHGHGKNSLAEIQIPWILSGPGVTPAQIAVPVNIFDTALTVAWIFHLDPSQCWIGRPVLSAFSPSLIAAHANAPRPDCASSAPLTRASFAGPTN